MQVAIKKSTFNFFFERSSKILSFRVKQWKRKEKTTQRVPEGAAGHFALARRHYGSVNSIDNFIHALLH
jgi:hypothetical protein